LAACLLSLSWTAERAKPGANYFVVLADNSMGMQIKDRAESRSRADFLRDLVAAKQDGLQNNLKTTFSFAAISSIHVCKRPKTLPSSPSMPRHCY